MIIWLILISNMCLVLGGIVAGINHRRLMRRVDRLETGPMVDFNLMKPWCDEVTHKIKALENHIAPTSTLSD